MASNDEWLMTARLACLELSSGEAEELAGQPQEWDELFALLARADVDDLAPTTHALLSGNRLREDKSRNFENRDSLIDKAPESEDGFFLIPNLL